MNYEFIWAKQLKTFWRQKSSAWNQLDKTTIMVSKMALNRGDFSCKRPPHPLGFQCCCSIKSLIPSFNFCSTSCRLVASVVAGLPQEVKDFDLRLLGQLCNYLPRFIDSTRRLSLSFQQMHHHYIIYYHTFHNEVRRRSRQRERLCCEAGCMCKCVDVFLNDALMWIIAESLEGRGLTQKAWAVL